VDQGEEDLTMVIGSIFTFLSDNWSDTLQSEVLWTLKLFGASLGIATVIAIPLGLWLGHIHRGAFLAINTSNVGRALPSLAVIAIGVTIFGLGFTNVMVALVILAVPVILTNTYVGVDQVDRELTEAARGMGMTGFQTLLRVELPVALPLLFAGLRTAALYIMATTPLAAITGAPGGLGDVIVNQASYRFVGVVTAALLVSALAFAADGLFALLQHYVTPRALRGRGDIEAKGSVLEAT
jgi:osmoprotectant transport system permease protein